jgi:hypothetical protein
MPWSLAGRIDMEEVENRGKKIPRSSLINSLNRINFKNGDIILKFKHKKYNNFISLKAKPQTCNDMFLECLWSEPCRIKAKWNFYDLEGFSFTDGLNQIQVDAHLIDHNDQGLIVELPEYSYETRVRAIKRHPCREVSAQISQNGSVITGSLINFCAESLAVRCNSESTHVNLKIQPEFPANVVLTHKDEFVFSGKCTIVRHEKHADGSILVFKPEINSIRRMKLKEHATGPLVLSPLPNLIFHHPLTQKKILLGITDISGLGFSVEEDIENSVLLSGLIIHNLEIELIHGLSIACKAQVLCRIPKEEVVRCEMVILDMNLQDHIKLSSLTHKAKNKHTHIDCTNIDLEALWDFFFDTGFVYPQKYIHIAEQKDKFISIYKKFYHEHPEIARHVIYQDKGKIFGHISMFRFYQNAWLLHHHAAVKSSKHKAGLVVMDHLLQYIFELHSLPSGRINYIAAYFRQNNRFASRVFVATSHAMKDPEKSSLDEFAYFYLPSGVTSIPTSNSLTLCTTDAEDLEIFKNWYDEISGGLMFRAFDLDAQAYSIDEETNKDFLKAGFKRERRFYSLKKNDELLAILIVNKSDFGLNMSELTNCIQFFVLDQNQINRYTYNFAIAKIVQFCDKKNVPVLLYPKSFAEKIELSYEKIYVLGILNVEYLHECLELLTLLTAPKKSDIFTQKLFSSITNLHD